MYCLFEKNQNKRKRGQGRPFIKKLLTFLKSKYYLTSKHRNYILPQRDIILKIGTQFGRPKMLTKLSEIADEIFHQFADLLTSYLIQYYTRTN